MPLKSIIARRVHIGRGPLGLAVRYSDMTAMRRISRAGYLLVVAGAALIGTMNVLSIFLTISLIGLATGPDGISLKRDFLAFWSSGDIALHGQAFLAYDEAFQRAHQSAMTHLPDIGGPFPYPPHYLILLSMLAVLPYGAAFIAFIAATLLIYAVMVIAISQRKEAIFFALATPGMAACIETGQNGFLTASLMGVALVLRESSPRFAGLGLALLTYKPQMGVLFPAALTLERRWIVMASAAVATVALLTIALAAFGTRTFMEFPQALAAVADATVFTDRIGYEKLQSVYGLARYLGFTARAAWGAHLAVAFIAVAAVAGTWRKPERPWLKAAVLTSAALLISPHLFLYDMPVCGVAIAFLVRDRDLAPLEWAAVLGACALASFLEFWLRPFGVFSTLAVFSVASLRSLKA